jgi:hypothetical protein
VTVNNPTPFGALPPRYTFALNPRLFARVNQCPDCHVPTKELIVPLLVRVGYDGVGYDGVESNGVHPDVWIVIRTNCRHCPQCDLLIADQRRLEGAMAAMLMQRDPSVIGHDYQVLGTVQTRTWEAGMRREGAQQPMAVQTLRLHVHDFVALRTLETKTPRPPAAQPAARKAKRKREHT